MTSDKFYRTLATTVLGTDYENRLPIVYPDGTTGGDPWFLDERATWVAPDVDLLATSDAMGSLLRRFQPDPTTSQIINSRKWNDFIRNGVLSVLDSVTVAARIDVGDPLMIYTAEERVRHAKRVSELASRHSVYPDVLRCFVDPIYVAVMAQALHPGPRGPGTADIDAFSQVTNHVYPSTFADRSKIHTGGVAVLREVAILAAFSTPKFILHPGVLDGAKTLEIVHFDVKYPARATHTGLAAGPVLSYIDPELLRVDADARVRKLVIRQPSQIGLDTSRRWEFLSKGDVKGGLPISSHIGELRLLSQKNEDIDSQFAAGAVVPLSDNVIGQDNVIAQLTDVGIQFDLRWDLDRNLPRSVFRQDVYVRLLPQTLSNTLIVLELEDVPYQISAATLGDFVSLRKFTHRTNLATPPTFEDRHGMAQPNEIVTFARATTVWPLGSSVLPSLEEFNSNYTNPRSLVEFPYLLSKSKKLKLIGIVTRQGIAEVVLKVRSAMFHPDANTTLETLVLRDVNQNIPYHFPGTSLRHKLIYSTRFSILHTLHVRGLSTTLTPWAFLRSFYRLRTLVLTRVTSTHVATAPAIDRNSLPEGNALPHLRRVWLELTSASDEQHWINGIVGADDIEELVVVTLQREQGLGMERSPRASDIYEQRWGNMRTFVFQSPRFTWLPEDIARITTSMPRLQTFGMLQSAPLVKAHTRRLQAEWITRLGETGIGVSIGLMDEETQMPRIKNFMLVVEQRDLMDSYLSGRVTRVSLKDVEVFHFTPETEPVDRRRAWTANLRTVVFYHDSTESVTVPVRLGVDTSFVSLRNIRKNIAAALRKFFVDSGEVYRFDVPRELR